MQKRSLLAVAIAIDGVLAAAVTNNAVGKAASKKMEFIGGSRSICANKANRSCLRFSRTSSYFARITMRKLQVPRRPVPGRSCQVLPNPPV